jgi:hypothetical protein
LVSGEHYRIQADKIECETIDDEVIIIQFDTGNYYTLSGLGAFIWHSLEVQPTFSDVLTRVGTHYETDANPQLSAEILPFLNELVSENLVERVANADPDIPAADKAVPAARQPYEPPVLERYSDMQALLLLDPIHEVDAQGWPHFANSSE